MIVSIPIYYLTAQYFADVVKELMKREYKSEKPFLRGNDVLASTEARGNRPDPVGETLVSSSI